MPKPPEAFTKEYLALMHELDSAVLQLKEAEHHLAQHDDALRDQAHALGQRVGALRTAAGTAGAGRGLELFKTDPEVGRLLASLDETVAHAEAGRQHYQALAAGAWSLVLKRAATLEKELAAEIVARQKLLTTKTGPANKAVADMLLLQTDVRKKLTPRRVAFLAGEQALAFHKDPQYFLKRRSEWQAAALGAGPAARPDAAPSTAKAASKSSSTPGPGKTATPPAAAPSAAATPPAPGSAVDPLLTVATFKIAGTEVRQLFAAIRTSTLTARQAARRKNPTVLAAAKASANERMVRLELVVKQYELARQQTGDEAIRQLPSGRQLLTGIPSLVAVRAKARTMIGTLAKLR